MRLSASGDYRLSVVCQDESSKCVVSLNSVNDPFVMSAWGAQFNTKGKIRMLADPSAAFTKALELSLELPPLGKFSDDGREILNDKVTQHFRRNTKQALLNGD